MRTIVFNILCLLIIGSLKANVETLNVPFRIVNANDSVAICNVFESLPNNVIDKVNWPEYPYAPTASFKIFHDGKHIFVRFEVEEEDIQALAGADQGRTFMDPCVEFFIAFDNSGYYNFECNCIGKILASFNIRRGVSTRSPEEILNSVQRMTTLGNETFELRKGLCKWSVIEIIPITAFFKHDIPTLRGITATANFYNCGLPHNHFLSWAPIDTPKPNFHTPQFFGTVTFE